MKILLVHTFYNNAGGEDSVVSQEIKLLQQHYTLEHFFFKNKGGVIGAFQFFFSIWNIVAAIKLKRIIKKFQPNVIHVHNWHFAIGPIIFRIAKKMNIPVVHTIHNYRLLCPSAILFNNNEIFTDSLIQDFPWTAVRAKVYRNSLLQTFWLAFIIWFHKKIGTWRNVDRFVCLTPFAKHIFVNSTFGVDSSKFFIKPNFFIEKYINLNSKRLNHFLFVGRLTEEKGIRLLLCAVVNSGLKIRIVGDGPLKEIVQKSQSANPNIEYVGSLSKNDVISEMTFAQALIFPSLWFEGMPMTIIESFSCATPVIASDLGAMQSMVEHNVNGMLFKPGDSDNLVDILKSFHSKSEDQKEAMRSNAFKSYKKDYTSDKQLEYLSHIYTSLIK